jgi:dihydrofolate synthase/folylpolyglutamate synthase
VFGAMRDKDAAAMLARLSPLVDHWHFTDLPLARAARAEQLAAAYVGLVPRTPAATVACHAGPAEALQAAVSQADPADRIVVLGSFLTVGGVMQQGLPRLAGPHGS